MDYLYHDDSLQAVPAPIALVDDRQPLPSSTEPSDHTPVMARFTWVQGSPSGELFRSTCPLQLNSPEIESP